MIQTFCKLINNHDRNKEEIEKILKNMSRNILYMFYHYSLICLEKNIGNVDIARNILFYIDKLYYKPLVGTTMLLLKTQCLIKTEKSFLCLYVEDKYNELIKKCIEEVKNELLDNPPIKLYGKTVYQQRSIGFFSDKSIGYYYSGQLAKAKPLYTHLSELMNTINERFGTGFNGILVNKYIDGNNYISDHSDDEKNLDKAGVISISYGAVRKFRIRDKLTKKIILDIPTISNSIIHMSGDFQKEFTHGIPVEKKVKGLRYSFTFRLHLK
jgi:alkylated DNA repair dioxygenase AlkB